VAKHQIERLGLERKPFRIGLNGVDLEPQPPGRCREHVQHSGGDVDRGRLRHHSGSQKVDREVAGAGSDFQ